MNADGAAAPAESREGGGKRGSPVRRWRRPAAPAALCLLAAAVRWPLLPFISGDMAGGGGRGWPHWHAFILENGGFAALGHDFGLYNIAWLTLLAGVATAAPALPAVYAIKAISLPFDFALAFFVYRCVALRYRESRTAPLYAAAATLLAPAVVVNGAMWGQSDAIYATFLVACLYCLLTRRPGRAFAAFGLALAFKAQAVFFAPFLLWVLVKRRVDWPWGLLSPLVYVATLVPSWILGRNFYEMLFTYPDQSGQFSELVKGAANLYQWLPDSLYPYWPAGAAFTGAFVLAVALVVRKSRAVLGPDLLVTLAAFSVLVVPYLLPKMHDRYFFPADALVVVLAFYRPRLWFLAPAVMLVSAQSHLLFLTGVEVVPLAVCAAILLVVLVVLGRRLFRDLGVAAPARGGPGRFRARRGALAPAALLGAALAGVFLVGLARARSETPLVGDAASAAVLARAANLSREYDFALFTRLTPGEEGEVRRVGSPGVPLGGPALFGVALAAAGRDLRGQVTAARVLALALLLGAAALAYRSLRKLSENRWLAVGATLGALSLLSATGRGPATLAGAAEAFGALLLFHGLVVFVREGRFRQLVVSAGAALLLTFSAYALLAAFLALWLGLHLREVRALRGAGNGAGGEPGGTAGAPAPAGEARVGEAPVGEAPGGVGGDPGIPVPAFGRRSAGLALAGLLFGAAFVGIEAANAAAAFPGEADAAASGSFAAAAGSSAAAAGPFAAAAGGEAPVGGGAGPAGSAEASAGPGPPAGLAGLLLTLGCLVGAGLSRYRLCLLPLAVWGASALLLPLPFPDGGWSGAGPFGVWLGLSVLALLGLRRLAGERALPVAAGVAALAALVVAGTAGAGYGADGAAPEVRGREEIEDRVVRDFEEIRRVLRGRPEAKSLFLDAPALDRVRVSGPDAADWYLAGTIFTTDEARRGLAEFVIAVARRSERGLLTPGNRELFLYHREALDGEMARRIGEAGPPRAVGDFAVHLHESRKESGSESRREWLLLYVRDGCRPEDLEPQVILHLDPVEKGDLPPHRRQWGFDNLSFRFRDHAWSLGEPCVAGARLPDYPLRRIVTGQFRRSEFGFEEVWRVEIPFAGGSPR